MFVLMSKISSGNPVHLSIEQLGKFLAELNFVSWTQVMVLSPDKEYPATQFTSTIVPFFTGKWEPV